MNMRFPFLLAVLGVAAVTALAQTPGAVNQVESVEQRQRFDQSARQQFDNGDSVPALYPGEESDVGPQTVVVARPRKTLFEAVADEQYFYTDNVFLQNSRKLATTVLVSTIQLALAPSPYEIGGGQFAPGGRIPASVV